MTGRCTRWERWLPGTRKWKKAKKAESGNVLLASSQTVLCSLKIVVMRLVTPMSLVTLVSLVTPVSFLILVSQSSNQGQLCQPHRSSHFYYVYFA